MAEKDCARCDKKGFPVLLTRYALGYGNMPNAINNGVKLLPTMPSLNSAEGFYTLRTLYNGYVYLFDPSDKKLRCFQVSSDETAVLTEIKIESPAANNAFIKKHEACGLQQKTVNKTMRYGNAVLLTIPRANQSRVVYVTFSQFFWNDAIVKLNTNVSNVQKYMTPIKVNGLNEYSKPIMDLGKIVFEYANAGKNKVDWTQNQLSDGKLGLTELPAIVVNEANRLNAGKGIIVPIYDPISLLNDISGLLQFKRNNVLNSNEKKMFEYYNELKEFKNNLYNSGRQTAIYEEIYHQKQLGKMSSIGNDPDIFLTKIQQSIVINKIEAKAKKIGNENIERFFSQLKSKNSMDTWYKNNIQKKYNNFIVSKANILDKFFVDSFKSNILQSFMTYQFDKINIHSGVNYTNAVTAMLGQMQLYQNSFNYICSLLKGNINDKKNYVLRACVWGNEDLCNKIANQTDYQLTNNPYLDKSWSVLLGARANILGKNLSAISEANLLTSTIDKPVAYTFRQAATGQIKLSHLALAWGVNNNKIVSFLTLEGGHKDLSTFFAKYIQKLAGNTIPVEDIERITKLAMTEFMIGQKVDTPTISNKTHIIVHISLAEFKQFIADLRISGNYKAEGLKVILRNVKDFHQYLDDFCKKEFRIAATTNVKESFRLAKAAGILQVLNIGVLAYRLCKDDSLDNQFSLYGGAFNTLSMAFAIKDQAMRTQASKMEKALNQVQMRTSRLLIGGAMGTAALGGIFFAVVDGRAAFKAFEEDNKNLGFQYTAATILGFSATGTGIWSLLKPSTGINVVTFVITAVYIGLSIYINNSKLEPVQKSIGNSPWGNQPNMNNIAQQITTFHQNLKNLT